MTEIINVLLTIQSSLVCSSGLRGNHRRNWRMQKKDLLSHTEMEQDQETGIPHTGHQWTGIHHNLVVWPKRGQLSKGEEMWTQELKCSSLQITLWSSIYWNKSCHLTTSDTIVKLKGTLLPPLPCHLLCGPFLIAWETLWSDPTLGQNWVRPKTLSCHPLTVQWDSRAPD